MLATSNESNRTAIREDGRTCLRATTRPGMAKPEPASNKMAEDRRPRFPPPKDDGFPEWMACPGEG